MSTRDSSKADAKPVASGNAHVLPFERLDPTTFERLCLWLVEAEGYSDAEHYGLAGSDDGRDVVASRGTANGSELWYFQCKRRERVDTPTLTNTIDAIVALTDLPKRPAGLIFITTCAISAQIRDAAKKHGKKQRLRVLIWAETELDGKAKRHPRLLEEFFGFGIHRGRPREVLSPPKLDRPDAGSIPDPGPLPDGSRMQLRDNSAFVGRKDELLALSRLLYAPGTSIVVTGIGGAGKTQLASAFVHRYGRYFDEGVFWINCADPRAIEEQVIACASSLGIEGTADEKIERVRAVWNSRGTRLLIFDNCDEERTFEAWRPASNGSSVLATSRAATWSQVVARDLLPLGMLPRSSSVELLAQLCPSHGTELEGLDELAAELGDLPLALHLAGSFLERYNTIYSTDTLLEELRKPDLLEHRALVGHRRELHESPTHHELCVARTFAVSFERLRNEDQEHLCVKLLSCASHLASGIPIPSELLAATAEVDTSTTIGAVQLEDALQLLCGVGLLERTDGSLRLHRLIAAYVQGVGAPGSRELVEECLAGTMDLWNGIGHVPVLNEIADHLRWVTTKASPRNDILAARLAHGFGFYLARLGRLREGVDLLREAHERFVLLEGEEGGNAGRTSNSLAMCLRQMGDLGTAAVLQRRNVERAEAAFGADSAELAPRLSNLAMTLMDLGQEDEAKSLLLRSKKLNESHPDVIVEAGIHNNLGLLYFRQGAYEDGIRSLERTLTLRRGLFGEDHFEVALSYYNLGCVLSQVGRHEEAVRNLETAHRLYVAVLGASHPDSIRALAYLGHAYLGVGDVVRAADTFRSGLRTCSEIDRADDRVTAQLLVGLAEAEEESDAFDEAERHLLRAVEVLDKLDDAGPLADCLERLVDLDMGRRNFARARDNLARLEGMAQRSEGTRRGAIALTSMKRAMLELVSDRPDVAVRIFGDALNATIDAHGEDSLPVVLCLEQTAMAYERMGKVPEARALLSRAFTIRERLALLDSTGAMALLRLGMLSLGMADHESAEEQLRKALEIQERILGKRDPSLADALCALANVFGATGRVHDARQTYRRALSLLERADRSGHIADGIIACLAGLGRVERELGNLTAAEKAQEKALALSVATFGLQHRRTALCLNNLGVVAFARGNSASALDLMRQSIAIYELTLGAHHSETRSANEMLRVILRSR